MVVSWPVERMRFLMVLPRMTSGENRCFKAVPDKCPSQGEWPRLCDERTRRARQSRPPEDGLLWSQPGSVAALAGGLHQELGGQDMHDPGDHDGRQRRRREVVGRMADIGE